ncbi:MAG TPA: hypothetical protein VNP72_08025, partial [Longimicrobium sp.]|nr:hypothetical protein [Longimicrobium sp.]
MATPYSQLRYNQVRARGSHNSYQRDEDIADQLLFWRLRHIELDLHVAGGVTIATDDDPFRATLNPGLPLPRRRRIPGDWFVYHDLPSAERPSVNLFSDGLALLAGFHKAVPQHEVVTVALDIKNGFQVEHTPADLDRQIQFHLPGLVYTPADFIKDVPNPTKLQDNTTWPFLKDLRGKFIFICTTKGLAPGSNLSQYIADGASKRTCFVAPEISKKSAITDDENKDAVFFNMTVGNAPELGGEVIDKGFISRAYGANSKDDFDKAKKARCHLIGTDKVNTDAAPWSRTHNARGFPFQGIGRTVSGTQTEPGTIFQFTVQSGDIYDRADSCVFKYTRDVPASGKTLTYTYAVAVPSSHTADRNGKAGLMARASLKADAANFAIVRVADNNEPRAQVRAEAGQNTEQYKVDVADTSGSGITGESWMWVMLKLSDGGRTMEGLTSY